MVLCLRYLKYVVPHGSVSYARVFINLDSDVVCMPAERFSSLRDGHDACAEEKWVGKKISRIGLTIASALKPPCRERGWRQSSLSRERKLR